MAPLLMHPGGDQVGVMYATTLPNSQYGNSVEGRKPNDRYTTQ